MSGPDRTNRLVAALVGGALAVAGGYTLARSLGAVGDPSQPVLGEGLHRNLAENAGLAGGVATFVALMIAWAGWRWLRSQLLPSPSLAAIRLADGSEGRTTLEAKAVVEAVTRDLEAAPGVASGRARLVGDPTAPAVDLHADLSPGADLTEVRRHVDEVVVPRLRDALEVPDLVATARYRIVAGPGRSVL